MGGQLTRSANSFVMPDHFLDDKAQELLREIRVELGGLGQGAKACNLYLFTSRIGRRHAVLGFIFPHCLGAFEPFRQQVHQRCIDIVDAVSQPQKLWIGRGHVIPFIRLAALRHAA